MKKAKSKAKKKHNPVKGERPCSQCRGRNRSQSKYTTCKTCRKKNADRARKRYHSNKKKGICVRCGKNKVKKGESYCDSCLDYMSRYW